LTQDPVRKKVAATCFARNVARIFGMPSALPPASKVRATIRSAVGSFVTSTPTSAVGSEAPLGRGVLAGAAGVVAGETLLVAADVGFGVPGPVDAGGAGDGAGAAVGGAALDGATTDGDDDVATPAPGPPRVHDAAADAAKNSARADNAHRLGDVAKPIRAGRVGRGVDDARGLLPRRVLLEDGAQSRHKPH